MANFEEILSKHQDTSGVIPAAAITTLISAIKQAVGNEFVDKARYKAKLDEIDELKTKQQTAEDSATTAEKWKTKYDALKTEYGDYKTSVESEKSAAAKKTAYVEQVLKTANINPKLHDKIAKLTDLTTVELDADGKVKDADKLVASLKTEWADFVGAPTDTGVPTTNPPPTDGETDTDKMDDAAYYAYIAQQKKG